MIEWFTVFGAIGAILALILILAAIAAREHLAIAFTSIALFFTILLIAVPTLPALRAEYILLAMAALAVFIIVSVTVGSFFSVDEGPYAGISLILLIALAATILILDRLDLVAWWTTAVILAIALPVGITIIIESGRHTAEAYILGGTLTVTAMAALYAALHLDLLPLNADVILYILLASATALALHGIHNDENAGLGMGIFLGAAYALIAFIEFFFLRSVQWPLTPALFLIVVPLLGIAFVHRELGTGYWEHYTFFGAIAGVGPLLDVLYQHGPTLGWAWVDALAIEWIFFSYLLLALAGVLLGRLWDDDSSGEEDSLSVSGGILLAGVVLLSILFSFVTTVSPIILGQCGVLGGFMFLMVVGIRKEWSDKTTAALTGSAIVIVSLLAGTAATMGQTPPLQYWLFGLTAFAFALFATGLRKHENIYLGIGLALLITLYIVGIGYRTASNLAQISIGLSALLFGVALVELARRKYYLTGPFVYLGGALFILLGALFALRPLSSSLDQRIASLPATVWSAAPFVILAIAIIGALAQKIAKQRREWRKMQVDGEVYEGAMFLYALPAPDASVTVRSTRTGAEDSTETELDAPTILPRLEQKWEIGGKGFAATELPTAPLLGLSTDKTIYRQGDRANLIIIAPSPDDDRPTPDHEDDRAARSVAIRIERLGQPYDEREARLNSDGVAIVTLDDMEHGAYRIVARLEGTDTEAETSFDIVEYSLSPFEAHLDHHELVDGKLTVECFCTLLTVPFDGAIELRLFDHETERVVYETNTTVKNGVLAVEDISLGTTEGPFSLQLATQEGYTASVFVQGTKRAEREEALLGTFASEHSHGSMVPRQGSKSYRDIHIRRLGDSDSPVAVEHLAAAPEGTVELRVRQPIKIAKMVVYRPQDGGVEEYDYRNLEDGTTVTLPISTPYALAYLGAVVERGEDATSNTNGEHAHTLWEGFQLLFGSQTLQLDLDAPAHVEPSSAVTVTLETNERASVVLLAYDARLVHENAAKEVSSSALLGAKDVIERAGLSSSAAPQQVFFQQEYTPKRSGPSAPSLTISRPKPATPPPTPQEDIASEESLEAEPLELQSSFDLDLDLEQGGAPLVQAPAAEYAKGGILKRAHRPRRKSLRKVSMSTPPTRTPTPTPTSTQDVTRGAYPGDAVGAAPPPVPSREPTVIDDGTVILDETVIQRDRVLTGKISASDGRATLLTRLAADEDYVRDKAYLELTRRDFPEVIHCQLYQLDGRAPQTVRIELGDQIGIWKFQAYAVANGQYVHDACEMNATKPVSVELDCPAILSPGDECYAKILYSIVPGNGHDDGTAASGNGVDTWATLQLSGVATMKKRVSKVGSIEVPITEPGTLTARLRATAGSDEVEVQISAPGVEPVTRSQLELIGPDDQLPAFDRATLYPGYEPLIAETVAALVDFPYGCAEQTASKAGAVALAYALERANPGVLNDQDELSVAALKARLDAAHNRLQRFEKGGLYGIWEHSDPSTATSQQVLYNLLPLKLIAEEKWEATLQRTAEALRERGVIDNRFIALDRSFRGEIRNIQDAVAVCLATDSARDRQRLKKKIIALAHHMGTDRYWTSHRYWGGEVEATADALQVFLDEDDPWCNDLFRAGFQWVASKLEEGRLFSTTQTRSLIHLLYRLRNATDSAIAAPIVSLPPDARARFKRSRRVTIKKKTTVTTPFKPRTPLLARFETDTEVDHRHTLSSYDFSIAIRPCNEELSYARPCEVHMEHGHNADAQLFEEVVAAEGDEARAQIVDAIEQRYGRRIEALHDREPDTTAIEHPPEPIEPSAPPLRFVLGDRVTFTIKLHEETRCPVANIYLPGCLALMRGGANAQTLYRPIKSGELTLDAVAVRRGKSGLYIIVYDMYDEAKIGVSKRVEVEVYHEQEPLCREMIRTCNETTATLDPYVDLGDAKKQLQRADAALGERNWQEALERASALSRRLAEIEQNATPDLTVRLVTTRPVSTEDWTVIALEIENRGNAATGGLEITDLDGPIVSQPIEIEDIGWGQKAVLRIPVLAFETGEIPVAISFRYLPAFVDNAHTARAPIEQSAMLTLKAVTPSAPDRAMDTDADADADETTPLTAPTGVSCVGNTSFLAGALELDLAVTNNQTLIISDSALSVGADSSLLTRRDIEPRLPIRDGAIQIGTVAPHEQKGCAVRYEPVGFGETALEAALTYRDARGAFRVAQFPALEVELQPPQWTETEAVTVAALRELVAAPAMHRESIVYTLPPGMAPKDAFATARAFVESTGVVSVRELTTEEVQFVGEAWFYGVPAEGVTVIARIRVLEESNSVEVHVASGAAQFLTTTLALLANGVAATLDKESTRPVVRVTNLLIRDSIIQRSTLLAGTIDTSDRLNITIEDSVAIRSQFG